MGLFSKSAPEKPAGVAKKVGSATKSTGVFKSSGAKRAAKGDDDDVDYQPTGVTGARIATGWGGAKKMQQEATTYSKPLALKDKEAIVMKFAEDAPYASVAVHWLDRKGRRSFTCIGPKCPLCARGDTPTVYHLFNVIKLTDDVPLSLTLQAKSRVFGQIEELAKDAKTTPLSRRWYTFKRTGAGLNDTVYSFNHFRRVIDIAEEFPELRVPDEAELKSLKRFTVKDAQADALSRQQLEEIAKEMEGAVDPDDDDDDDDE